VESENARISFTEDGIAAIAQIAALANSRMENIGARRLHTVMTALLEDLLFDLPDPARATTVIDGPLVRERLKTIVEDEDLRRYIL
jgi:ATP-dependent HslUV protease ATP-binding subunit HslU